MRDGAEHTANVRLGTLPAEKEARERHAGRARGRTSLANLGLSLAPAGVAGAKEGVVVTEVDPDGGRRRRACKSGDIILEAAGQSGEPARAKSPPRSTTPRRTAARQSCCASRPAIRPRFVALATNPAVLRSAIVSRRGTPGNAPVRLHGRQVGISPACRFLRGTAI